MPSMKPSSAEESKDHSLKQPISLRLHQALDVFKDRKRTTPKQLAKMLEIPTNTACEHLRQLEHLGYVRRVRRGLYEKM
jgi:DNA-binding MarR family transcriptional regulator